MAVVGADGSLEASARFRQLAGIEPGAPLPDWLSQDHPEWVAAPVPVGIVEMFAASVGDMRLVALRDRTELVEMEDRLWAQQTALARVYAELKVREHALGKSIEALQKRELELSQLNRNLEARVQEQLSQLERTSSLRRYLSPEIANLVLTGEAPLLQTRKRNLTLVFADVPAFEELSNDLESEELIDILSAYHREMTAVLFEHGGTIDKFVSSRIIAFFGDPIPQEDHAARAVRAGLALRDAFRRLREIWFPGTDVEMNVGIHSGYATVGNVGSEHRVDYTVVGRNVTIASTLQLDAPPGEVVVSARTSEMVREHFSMEPVKLPARTGRAVAALRVAGPKVPTATNLGTNLGLGSNPSATTNPPGATTIPAEAPEPGKRLGHYLLEEVVGRGGMGQVFRARDEILHRTVAVKVVALELSSDPRFNERFMREARALASLNTPYITQIYSVSQNEVPAYFAMEFVEGRTLRQYLEEKRTLSVDDALDVFHQIVLGLSAAAQKGVIHRDVKPENVMLTHKGDVKLTDFGLVKSTEVDARTTTVGMIFGTPYYMSPEQARGEEIDFRADMYSAGALLFEVLTGEPPFHGPTALNILYRHQEDPLPSLQQIGHTFPTRVYSIIERLMAKKREDRYGSYDELVRAVEEAQRLAASGVVSRVGAQLATGSSEG